MAVALAAPASAQTSPSPLATPVQDCATGAPLRPFDPTITAGQPVDLTAQSRPGTRLDLYASDRQGSRQVRTATADAEGRATFTLRPVVSTTFGARQTPEPCEHPVFGQQQGIVTVRTALSLGAARTGTRTYAFAGRAFPAREGQLVRLFRRDAGGHEVLTSTTRVRTDGRWRIDRRFTGAGRYEFVARTPADTTNAAGASSPRPTLVY